MKLPQQLPSLAFLCPEKWENMTPTENGRHCKACDKVLVDFTKLSNEEVIRMIRTAGAGELCGHFRADQLQNFYGDFRDKLIALERSSRTIHRRNPFRYVAILALGILILFSGCGRIRSIGYHIIHPFRKRTPTHTQGVPYHIQFHRSITKAKKAVW